VSEDQSVERLSVAEAAERLGVTRDAIHKRISRRSIRHERGGDGRYYVWVDASTEGLDSSTDMSSPESTVEVLREMIASQERMMELTQERIAFLEAELERRGEAEERLHRIVAGLTQTAAQLSARVPELEAPATPEPPREPETPADEQQGRGPVAESPGPTHHTPTDVRVGQESGAERPWWRRWLG
jgi:excisionase family DNA binding protein